MINFDSVRGSLTDPLNQVPRGLLEKFVSDTAPQKGRVVAPGYNPATNMVTVQIYRAGGEPISLPCMTTYQGPIPGTGHAVEYHVGNEVYVHFENGQAVGRVAQAFVTPAHFTLKDHPGPGAGSASWAYEKTRGGTVTVHPNGDKIGHVEHIDNGSNRHTVAVGSHHVDDYGNKSIVRTGPNETQSAKKTKDAAKGFGSAAATLKGA